ncbi:PAS domain S-box protein [Leptospira ilyithenensis]|uniref:histidine kinase n=1 Tax=Leptospira ilyithenensis TaxID=2484901 RepID=A0A4R9LV72_9LEPT|nr:PAS domain S-box protein [Leptospira ilyithenensis]TGN13207.1 response regulator [Leptospira ilyithenensis]
MITQVEKQKRTLLIVEDDTIIGMAEAQALRLVGYTVYTASSGEKAIKLIQSGQEVDLILMDMDLGAGLDGTETSREILKMVEVPIVFLTSHAEKEMVEKVRGITRYGYVIKNSGNFVLQSSIDMAFDLFYANQKVKKKEESLRVTLNSIGDAVIASDNQGRITRMNPVAEKLTGWLAYEAIGAPVRNVFHIVNAKTRVPAKNPIDEVLKTGQIVGLANHTALLAKNGVEYQIADSGAPIQNEKGDVLGVVLVFRDVTADYKMQEELRGSEERFAAIFKASPMGMAVTRYTDGVYVSVNKAFCQLFEYRRDEIIGKSTKQTQHWWISEERDRLLEILRDTGRIEGEEMKIRKKSGDVADILVFVEQIVISGEKYLLSINHDITAKKHVEAELQKSLDEKEILLKELQHRVKNSLNVVSNLLGFELNHIKDEDTKRIFLNAQSRIHSMSKIYERLYRSSAIDRLDLHLYIKDLIDSFSEMYAINSKKIQFSVKLEKIQLDLKRALPVGLILNELITNALKYAYPNDHKGEIRVHLNQVSDHVNLVVSDDGCGLSKTTNPSEANTLGFMLVKNLTEQIDGVVSTISNPNEGLTVILSLKL